MKIYYLSTGPGEEGDVYDNAFEPIFFRSEVSQQRYLLKILADQYESEEDGTYLNADYFPDGRIERVVGSYSVHEYGVLDTDQLND